MSQKRTAPTPSIAARPAPCGRMVLWAGQIGVSSAFPSAGPESLKVLFGTCLLLSPALPPPFVPVTGPGLRRRASGEPNQEALGARRVPGATCCISAENCFFGCASGAGEASKSWCFLFALDSGELDSLARILPAKRIPHCRRDPFQELLGCGLAAEHRPLGLRLRRLLVRRSGGLGAQSEWAAWGRAGCVRKGPTSARSEQTRRKFVLPTLCPGDAGGERGDGGGRTDPGWGGGNTKWLRVWSAPARTPSEKSQFAGGFGAKGVRLVLSI